MLKTMFTPTIRKTVFAIAMAAAGAFTIASCGARGTKINHEVNFPQFRDKTPVEFAEVGVNAAQAQYSKDSAEFVRMAPDSNTYKKDYERLQQAVMAYYGVNNQEELNLARLFHAMMKTSPVHNSDSQLEVLEESMRILASKIKKSTGYEASKSKKILEEAKAYLERVKALEEQRELGGRYPDAKLKKFEQTVSEIQSKINDAKWGTR